ncbi:hypothetical protein Ade02nite_19880 [Paractinoplanes deccanensis]|uniref:Uncharacterized protein n=1 Tax=Paractinoplanes deccanensis TaxID=113561 RepID=A0ABQ3Y042_9ACTN|nr:hypothetical protein [Actinoplanes deccanensis]GID73347.1 hypothetical protein Ade02nite_19880 [Actinoplanes deccanensis]
MSAWETAGDGRWVRDNDDRHLLLHAGGRLVELHGVFVHVYTAAADMDPANPLGGAAHQATHDRPDLETAGQEQLWQAMTEYGEAP